MHWRSRIVLSSLILGVVFVFAYVLLTLLGVVSLAELLLASLGIWLWRLALSTMTIIGLSVVMESLWGE